MTMCTYDARTLASEASVEDLMMQARKIKYDVIGLIETRRHHPLHAAYDSGEELFLGTCDNRRVGGVAVCPRQHAFGHEHRFVRVSDKPNRTSATEVMWLPASFDCVRRVCPNIRLRR
ncbi:unnamed protein product [Heligmosomoides polygyrus]|uniref:Endo/exonuclease/phosphatase domain-containing protein n=1 Tax=Heligmosomoides polygyrus TaxID=6339 RepID=A0A183GDW1_HELPZ|nr:unnamed protein product [Heligmosomoides polygyrus]